MALSFNGITKTITISIVNTLDVKDLWSRWLDWFLTSDNSKYGVAMTNVGGDDIDLIAGTTIPIYLFLQNGWKIKPREANHTLTVSNGILLTSDSSDPFINTTGSFVIRINYQQPVQAITVSTGGGGGGGGGGASVEDISSAVWESVLETDVSAATILKMIASVLAGKSKITNLGGGSAEIIFRDITDNRDAVTVTMLNSERTDVIHDP